MRTNLKPGQMKRFERNLAKARSKDSMRAFSKLVQMVDERSPLVGDPPLIIPIENLLPDMDHLHLPIRRYHW